MCALVRKTILSTADIARLFNVTETTVKRWADEGTLRCQKTPGGHRKFEIRSVVEFADRNNFEPIGTLAIPEDDRLAQRIQVAVLGRDFSELVAAFVEKVLSPEGTDLVAFLSYLYQHHVALWELYDLILAPGMAEIGVQWKRGEIGISHEHRASYGILDAIAKLQAQVHTKPPNGLSALCACLGDEEHEIGLRCVSYLLESEGWSACHLGAHVPRDAMKSALHEMRPTIICLSATLQAVNDHRREELDSICTEAHLIGARVFLGGGGAGAVAATAHGVDAFCSTLHEFVTALETVERELGPGQGEEESRQ